MTYARALLIKHIQAIYNCRMNINRITIQKHKVIGLLSETIELYEYLSTHTTEFRERGAAIHLGYDSIYLKSIGQTLLSIKVIIQNECISDAFTLLRKYYESVLVHAYLSVLWEKEKKEYLLDNSDNFVKKWLYSQEKILPYKLIEKINQFEKAKELWDVLNNDGRYDKIKDCCNNFIHINYFSNIHLDSTQPLPEEYLNKVLDYLYNSLTDIVILHIGYIFILKQYYMMSSDYVDYLKSGIPPLENCEHKVAPFIQEYFSNKLTNNRNEIATVIRNNTNMIIDFL